MADLSDEASDEGNSIRSARSLREAVASCESHQDTLKGSRTEGSFDRVYDDNYGESGKMKKRWKTRKEREKKRYVVYA